MSVSKAGDVNAHYLGHVVATGRAHDVEVTEDIVSVAGIKLLAKGARIDPRASERLLEHKLRRPLEDCLQVADGVRGAELEPRAEALLRRHPLLAALCDSGSARGAPASLAALPLSRPMLSLLTVYASAQPGRLDHAVGVALLALALARRLLPGAVERQRALALAGLLHDVGELYIEPALLTQVVPLGGAEWRHIASHPLVGYRVLAGLDGMPRGVADAVLLHHERLDGFGYPRGVAGRDFALDGQILAMAEWLIALIEHDASPLARARMATRLVPGEFGAALLELIEAAAAQAPDEPLPLDAAAPPTDTLPRILRVSSLLDRLRQERGWIDERIAAAGPALGAVLRAGLDRLLRIQATYSSAGFDALHPALLLGEVAALDEPSAHVEIKSLVDELEWRVRELTRQQGLRGHLLAPADGAVVDAMCARLFSRAGSSTSDTDSRLFAPAG